MTPVTASRPSRVSEIECLRAIAIVMVLIEHLPFNLIWWFGPLFNTLAVVGRGWTGVDLFFAVSGFVIARSLLPALEHRHGLDAAVTVLRFWCRRAWRLLPSAWLWLALPFLPILFFNRSGAFHPIGADITGALAGFLELANFHGADLYGHGDLGVAFPYWSLSLEEQFYVLLPIAILLCRDRLPIVLGLLLLTTLQFQTPLTMMTRPGPLAIGVLLATVERRAPDAWRLAAPRFLVRRPLTRLLILFVCVSLLFLLGSDRLSIVSIRLLPITLIAGVLVFLAAQDGGFLWPAGRTRRAAEWLGARSYALYLVHIPVYAGAHEIWTRLPFGTRLPSGLGLLAFLLATALSCLLLADLNHRFLEEPLRRRGRRIAARIGTPDPVRPIALAG